MDLATSPASQDILDLPDDDPIRQCFDAPSQVEMVNGKYKDFIDD